MNPTNRFIQEKSSGLFFAPDAEGLHAPIAERNRASVYSEQAALATIRSHFGGDHGAELVNLIQPEYREFMSWLGRRGGSKKSDRKTKAVRKNGRKHKKQPELQTHE